MVDNYDNDDSYFIRFSVQINEHIIVMMQNDDAVSNLLVGVMCCNQFVFFVLYKIDVYHLNRFVLIIWSCKTMKLKHTTSCRRRISF